MKGKKSDESGIRTHALSDQITALLKRGRWVWTTDVLILSLAP